METKRTTNRKDDTRVLWKSGWKECGRGRGEKKRFLAGYESRLKFNPRRRGLRCLVSRDNNEFFLFVSSFSRAAMIHGGGSEVARSGLEKLIISRKLKSSLGRRGGNARLFLFGVALPSPPLPSLPSSLPPPPLALLLPPVAGER